MLNVNSGILMFPKAFTERIKNQVYIDSEALLNALEQPSPVSIRINREKFQKVPLNSEPVSWCKTGFYLGSRPSYTFDPLFHSGCYYPQEAAGMFLEEIFNQVVFPGQQLRVLDLCGAPGGKSTHLSSMIRPDGILVSNEVIRSRASILSENISRWGTSNSMVTQNDPSAFRELTGYFDVILVDAPCSGEGMFRDEIARTEWSLENTVHCSERQKRIVMDVWPALRETGILIYSTCTFNPGENEHNIKWLLGKHEAESVRLETGNFPDISEINYQGIRGYGFYPGRVRGDGLFFSVIRKKGSSAKTPKAGRNAFAIKTGKEEFVKTSIITKFREEQLIRLGDSVVALPRGLSDMQLLLSRLRIVKAGTKVFTVKNNDYLPSHELALSSGLKHEAFPAVELDYDQAINYLKREDAGISGVPGGWFLVRFKGINLGFAKNIGTRINNYYPVEMRIRMAVPEARGFELIKWD